MLEREIIPKVAILVTNDKKAQLFSSRLVYMGIRL